MTSVFLSYAHADRAAANLVAQTLASVGINVLSDQKIVVGGPVAASIEESVAHANGFVLLLSEAYLNSTWGQFELALAVDRAAEDVQVRVLPLLIDPAMRGKDIPPVLFDVQWLDQRRGIETAVLVPQLIKAFDDSANFFSGDAIAASEQAIRSQRNLLRQQRSLYYAERDAVDRGFRFSLVAALLIVVLSLAVGLVLDDLQSVGFVAAAAVGAVITRLGDAIARRHERRGDVRSR